MQAISKGHNGQYFTPEHVCDMMGAMSIGEAKVGQIVADCACGSGRMLLSAAKINSHMIFYSAYLDITCCKMALINMLLNSLKGEIAHMNSLSNVFYIGFKVQTTLVDGCHMPYYSEFTDPEQSCIWLKPLKDEKVKHPFATLFEPISILKPVSGIQGTLF